MSLSSTGVTDFKETKLQVGVDFHTNLVHPSVDANAMQSVWCGGTSGTVVQVSLASLKW